MKVEVFGGFIRMIKEKNEERRIAREEEKQIQDKIADYLKIDPTLDRDFLYRTFKDEMQLTRDFEKRSKEEKAQSEAFWRDQADYNTRLSSLYNSRGSQMMNEMARKSLSGIFDEANEYGIESSGRTRR